MRQKPRTRRSPITAATALALAFCTVAPAEAQLVTSNPRVNNGQLMIDPLLCQSDYEVRKAIAAAGFTHIFLNAPIENRIRARASRGNAVYLIDYDRCLDPRIIGVQRLRGSK
jgi:hypothetical protein